MSRWFNSGLSTILRNSSVSDAMPYAGYDRYVWIYIDVDPSKPEVVVASARWQPVTPSFLMMIEMQNFMCTNAHDLGGFFNLELASEPLLAHDPRLSAEIDAFSLLRQTVSRMAARLDTPSVNASARDIWIKTFPKMAPNRTGFILQQAMTTGEKFKVVVFSSSHWRALLLCFATVVLGWKQLANTARVSLDFFDHVLANREKLLQLAWNGLRRRGCDWMLPLLRCMLSDVGLQVAPAEVLRRRKRVFYPSLPASIMLLSALGYAEKADRFFWLERHGFMHPQFQIFMRDTHLDCREEYRNRALVHTPGRSLHVQQSCFKNTHGASATTDHENAATANRGGDATANHENAAMANHENAETANRGGDALIDHEDRALTNCANGALTNCENAATSANNAQGVANLDGVGFASSLGALLCERTIRKFRGLDCSEVELAMILDKVKRVP